MPGRRSCAVPRPGRDRRPGDPAQRACPRAASRAAPATRDRSVPISTRSPGPLHGQRGQPADGNDVLRGQPPDTQPHPGKPGALARGHDKVEPGGEEVPDAVNHGRGRRPPRPARPRSPCAARSRRPGPARPRKSPRDPAAGPRHPVNPLRHAFDRAGRGHPGKLLAGDVGAPRLGQWSPGPTVAPRWDQAGPASNQP